MLLQWYYFVLLWLYELYICTKSSLSIRLLMDAWAIFHILEIENSVAMSIEVRVSF